MNNEYYIKAIINRDFCRNWTFDTLESRDNVFKNVSEKFAMYQAAKSPFIEIDKGINGDESMGAPKVSFPLRLREEVKDEVIKYMDSLAT